MAHHPMRIAALLAGFALVLGGCFDESGTGTAPPPEPQPAPPGPVHRAPPAETPPPDNCGLDPADMDEATKAQCGLTGAPEGTGPGEETAPGGSGSPSGDEEGRVDDGADEVPAPEQYQRYREETGYPYDYEQYDQLPGYQQCGTACGQEPTSGEVQQQYGCEQGWIPAEQC
ncbi:hypothetical protein [Salinifilum ghardaiensis]